MFQASDESYKLRINWPNDLAGRNIWRQTSHPTTAPVQGYEAIDVQFTTQHWGGLELSTSGSTYVDGSVGHGNWFYSIGSKQVWSGGIPAHGPSAQRVALWVKPDTMAPFEVGAPFEGQGNVLAIMVKQADVEENHAAFDAKLVGYNQLKSPNTPPVFPLMEEQQLYVGVESAIQIEATDPEEEKLVYLAPNLPEGAALDFETGILTWTPNANDFGSRGVKIIVADVRGASKWQTVIFNISKDAPPPPEDAGGPVNDAGSVEEDSGPNPEEDAANMDDLTMEDTAPAPSSGGGCVSQNTPHQGTALWAISCLIAFAVVRRRSKAGFNG